MESARDAAFAVAILQAVTVIERPLPRARPRTKDGRGDLASAVDDGKRVADVAGNARKQGGRVTPKGTQPPAKKPKGGGTADAPPATPNREMRRAGIADAPASSGNSRRSRIILIAAAVVWAILTLGCIVALGWSGTWIGLLGIAAGAGVAIAIGTGKTWVVERGRLIGIGIGAVGVVSAVVGFTGAPVELSLWWTAPLGCAVGVLFAEITYQQTVPPQPPPTTAIAMLKRGGAQTMDAPGLGECVWITPDRKVRVIVGATLGHKTTLEKLLTDKSVRKSRQRGAMIHKRLGPLDPQPGVVCVVDAGVPTTRDGEDTICSVGSLSKVLGKWNPGPMTRQQFRR